MKNLIVTTARIVIWLYAIGILAWFVLRAIFGDSIWWLAVLNTFALYLFAPLLLTTLLILLQRRREMIAGWAVPAILFVSLFGEQLLPKPIAVQAAQGDALKVMTINVGSLTPRAEPIIERIQAESPDVVFIQELNPFHAAGFVKELKPQYPSQALLPIQHDVGLGAEGVEGLGILSRNPLSDHGWMSLGDNPYAAQRVELMWSGRRVELINVHLASTLPTQVLSEFPSRVANSFQRRELEAHDLASFVHADDHPTIVAGDFNMTDTTAAYGMLSESLSDAQREAGWGFDMTFPAARTNLGIVTPFPVLRIDYVFHSRDFSASDASVAAWDGQSDHRPFVATLRLKR